MLWLRRRKIKLNLSQICSVTTGAVRATDEEGGFNFYRFTAEQQELYKNCGMMRFILQRNIQLS